MTDGALRSRPRGKEGFFLCKPWIGTRGAQVSAGDESEREGGVSARGEVKARGGILLEKKGRVD